MKALRDAFDKFDEKNTGVWDPRDLKREFKKFGYDKSNPPLYSMICWIADANNFSGTVTMTFDEFIEYSMYFFSQKSEIEGLKYIFQLFDTDNTGQIDMVQFDRACVKCGITLRKETINEIFMKASKDGKYIKFSEFVFFMRKPVE